MHFGSLQRRCHSTGSMLLLAFLETFWGACHLRWFQCFYGLSLDKGAYAIYFNESDSTDVAQSYHIHEVESMLCEPNAPPEMSQGGGRPRHEKGEKSRSYRCFLSKCMVLLCQRSTPLTWRPDECFERAPAKQRSAEQLGSDQVWHRLAHSAL